MDAEPDNMKCVRCGHALMDSQKFCPNCGAPTRWPDSTIGGKGLLTLWFGGMVSGAAIMLWKLGGPLSQRSPISRLYEVLVILLILFCGVLIATTLAALRRTWRGEDGATMLGWTRWAVYLAAVAVVFLVWFRSKL